MLKKSRAFLKWAGGKYNLVDAISLQLPKAPLLVEPFVGAGSVFLNTDYPEYLLNDINADLIHLYQLLQTQPARFIADARNLFVQSSNEKSSYLSFNARHRQLMFATTSPLTPHGLRRYSQVGNVAVLRTSRI